MAKNLKPGEIAPRSGEYGIQGARGGNTGQERTAVKGKPLPPTPKPGQRYIMDRPAHNGAGKPKKSRAALHRSGLHESPSRTGLSKGDAETYCN
jgi:hypothetical protein